MVSVGSSQERKMYRVMLDVTTLSFAVYNRAFIYLWTIDLDLGANDDIYVTSCAEGFVPATNC